MDLNIGMDSDYRSGYEPTPCPHQPDIWDCSICGAEAYGGRTWRTCQHGLRLGECPECNGEPVEYPSDW